MLVAVVGVRHQQPTEFFTRRQTRLSITVVVGAEHQQRLKLEVYLNSISIFVTPFSSGKYLADVMLSIVTLSITMREPTTEILPV
jgi:hypothetical protein